HPALGGRHRVRDLAAEVVDASVDDLLLVLARRGHFRLTAPRGPHPGQRRQLVDLYLILEDQGEVRLRPQRLFLQPLQLLPGSLVGDLVPLALEGVFGALAGERLLLEQTPDLVVAVADPRDQGQVLGQAGGTPGGEAIAQLQRAGLHRLTQLRTEGVGGPAGAARTIAGVQRVETALAVQAADTLDGVRRAAQEVGDLRDGTAGVGAQDNQAVAEHLHRGGSETQPIQGLELLAAELNRRSHDNLLARPTGPWSG